MIGLACWRYSGVPAGHPGRSVGAPYFAARFLRLLQRVELLSDHEHQSAVDVVDLGGPVRAAQCVHPETEQFLSGRLQLQAFPDRPKHGVEVADVRAPAEPSSSAASTALAVKVRSRCSLATHSKNWLESAAAERFSPDQLERHSAGR